MSLPEESDFAEALISEKPIVVRRRVAWGECDPAGVVYTPRFADYALSARDWFMRRALGVFDRPQAGVPGVSYPMRAMSFEFLASLAADDIFDMTVALGKVSRRTFTVDVIAERRDGTHSFSATMTSVCVESRGRTSQPLPDSLREALAGYEAVSAPPA